MTLPPAVKKLGTCGTIRPGVDVRLVDDNDCEVPDGTVGEGRMFFDATSRVAGNKGLPDGLKVDERGNLWTSGPGGILVISPEGKLLGVLNTGEATANCAWGNDGRTLYITADSKLVRIRTLSRGANWPR